MTETPNDGFDTEVEMAFPEPARSYYGVMYDSERSCFVLLRDSLVIDEFRHDITAGECIHVSLKSR